MKRRSRILILVLLALFYVIFAARDTKKNIPSSGPSFLSFTQARTLSEMPGNLPKRVPFNSGFNFGYIDTISEIIYAQPSTARIAIDENGWITYTRLSETLEIHTLGQKASQISAIAYPWFKSTWRIIMRGDQLGIARIDDQGTLLWQREFPMQITAIDADSRYVVVGLLDGSIYIFDKNGNRIICNSQNFGGIRTVYAVAISDDDKYIVVLKGISPQKIETFKNDKNAFTLLHATEVANNSVLQGSMSVAKNGSYAVAAQGNEILYYNIKKNICRKLIFPQQNNDAQASSEHSHYFVIGTVGDDQVALLRTSESSGITSDVILLRDGLPEREWAGATGIASSGDSFAVLFQDGVELQ